MNIEEEVSKLMSDLGNDSPHKYAFFVRFLSSFKKRIETECATAMAQEIAARKREENENKTANQ